VIKKIVKWFALIVVVAVVGVWAFWPANLAVKGPILDFMMGRQVEAPNQQTLQSRFKLPDGFHIGVFASDVTNVRTIRTTSTGDILAASMRPGDIILLHRDEDGDGASDGRTVLASGLNSPHGIALYKGYLYIAENERIVRAWFDADTRTLGTLETVFEGLPEGGNHRTRAIGFGPDGMLYVTVGSSCNVCIEEQPYRASMLVMNPDGTDARTYATGLRNSVGFDWQPETGALYATDNGRDLLGDDTPHCELNLIEDGADYGWPYAYDDRQLDPDFGPGNKDKVQASKALVHGFGAHRAPLGIRFFTGLNVPKGYQGVALAALHGSWNRSTLAGYKVVSLHFAAGGSVEQRDFLTGFELDEDVIGRPVEMAFGLDGAIYISDDYAGVVYKIGWGDMVVPGFVSEEKAGFNPLAQIDEMTLYDLNEKGAAVFAENSCAACHDAALAAEGVQIKELKNLKARYDIGGLQALFAAPPGPMPVFHLSGESSQALAVYLLKNYSENER
jgi:glucose/arabinose dehydrogenase